MPESLSSCALLLGRVVSSALYASTEWKSRYSSYAHSVWSRNGHALQRGAFGDETQKCA